MACNCVEEVNGMLKERNTRLTQAITFGDRKGNTNLLLCTEQIEKGRGKKKAVSMFLSCCPFCGTRYEQDA